MHIEWMVGVFRKTKNCGTLRTLFENESEINGELGRS
jgi:hypothetical protein